MLGSVAAITAPLHQAKLADNVLCICHLMLSCSTYNFTCQLTHFLSVIMIQWYKYIQHHKPSWQHTLETEKEHRTQPMDMGNGEARGEASRL